MTRFCANLSSLWQEVDTYERFAAAADAGFEHVEIGFPHLLDVERIANALTSLGQRLELFNPAAGDWDAGERGLVALPGREREFAASVEAAIRLADRLGTRMLNPLVGAPPSGVGQDEAMATAVANLKALAPKARASGITILVEAVNTVDAPGYFAGTTNVATRIVEAADDSSVRLLFDTYHSAMMKEDIVAAARSCQHVLAHVHVADVPGHHEPGTGVQPIAGVLALLDDSGYTGLVGLEYIPQRDTASSLKWMKS